MEASWIIGITSITVTVIVIVWLLIRAIREMKENGNLRDFPKIHLPKIHVIVKEAERLPSRYHALGYRDPMMMASHFYIIPFHWFVKFWITINYWWWHLQTKESWFDKKWMEAYNKGREDVHEARAKAFEQGKASAIKQLIEQVEADMEQSRKEREAARAAKDMDDDRPAFLKKIMD